ncbi:class I adenylate-forming enzyme family protein [Rhizorhapis sp.]|uniref:class I adenylate-forming enzyme family protein n=1 Tax=Rhizorhapis sp. TaxID=1968842 RepID=UPI002B458D27|nr:AMP-binding protein [Rhizorhapis sp.]HKR18025.1 AMP-binding protein [Rhizorhapis sp.]
MGISSWIAHKAIWSPQNVAIQFNGKQITYRQLEVRIAALAGYLRDRLQVGEGSRVAYLGANSPAILELLFACARLGAVFVPLNSRLTAPQLSVMLENAAPQVLFSSAEFHEIAEACRVPSRDFASQVIQDQSAVPLEGTLDAAWLADRQTTVACNPGRDQNLPVLIAYTSGTTGTPKGAVFTQDALTFTAINSNNTYNMRGKDHVLTYLPMFHVGGLLIHTLPAFHIGAKVTIQKRFDPGVVLSLIDRQGVTLLLAPPVFSRRLTGHPDWAKTDLSGLRCVGIGSTFVPPEVMQAWFDRDVPTQQNYGLTEGVPVLASPWEHHRRRAASAGTSVLYTQARVVDEELNPLPPGEPGEIVLRGRSLFSGYWNNEEATRSAFTEGWFRTGDIAYCDDEGYFYIVDRKKNIVIVGSSNVYPADVEKVLEDMPGIAEAAVIGIPDSETGEALVACVRPSECGAPGFSDVLSHCRKRLAEYQLPTYMVICDEFPRTSLGKIRKPELKASALSSLNER